MKILIINTSEQTGGAAIAANRLMHALQKTGIEAKMLVRDKQTNNSNVISINVSWFKRKINFFQFLWERLVIFCSNGFNRKNLFRVSIANTGTDISQHSLVKWADVIHIHWINQGFLSLQDIDKLIKTGKPIVWTMHDMWPCTSICHHACGCERFLSECGKCLFLDSSTKNDLSYKTWKKKQFIVNSQIHIVTVSSWLKQMARQSSITKNLNTAVIPNVIDTTVFAPLKKQKVRKALGFSLEKKIILMGAARLDDPIKGFDYLQQIVKLLSQKENILLILFGGLKQDIKILSEFPIEVFYYGLISDAFKIAQLYAVADVTIVPSLYETFGQTLVESMACGCPVVSFNNSGQTDIIDHKQNGYLAEYRNIEDFVQGIEWVLNYEDQHELSDACVKKVQENYTEEIVAEKYLSLYNSLLENK